MPPVGDQTPVAGSYSSALASATGEQTPRGQVPPVARCVPPAASARPSGSSVADGLTLSPVVNSTLPFARSVAVCPERKTTGLPVGLQVPVAGSYSSA